MQARARDINIHLAPDVTSITCHARPKRTCEASAEAFSIMARMLDTPPEVFMIWSMDLLSVATEAIIAMILSYRR